MRKLIPLLLVSTLFLGGCAVKQAKKGLRETMGPTWQQIQVYAENDQQTLNEFRIPFDSKNYDGAWQQWPDLDAVIDVKFDEMEADGLIGPNGRVSLEGEITTFEMSLGKLAGVK